MAHDNTEVNARGMLWFTVIFVACLVVIGIGISWFERAVEKPVGTLRFGERILPAGPPLQPSVGHATREGEDDRILRAKQEARLNSYGRDSGEAGFARIPIDRAITLYVERK